MRTGHCGLFCVSYENLRERCCPAEVLGMGRKARLGDALIAQSCVEAGVALITRDRNFQALAEAAGLDPPAHSEAGAD